MKKTIGIYIYNQVEVLDFAGPFEVFSTATRLVSDKNEQGFDVFLIAETADNGREVQARGGFPVQPHYSIHNHPPLHVLLVPGGVHDGEMSKSAVLSWMAAQHSTTQLTASVCTGAFLLAQANILTSPHTTVTTHWDDINGLRTQFPHLTVVEGQRWVDQGKIVTSAGISAGIDMALHLVSKLESLDLAERTARQMEFDWTKNASK